MRRARGPVLMLRAVMKLKGNHAIYNFATFATIVAKTCLDALLSPITNTVKCMFLGDNAWLNKPH